MIRNLILAGFVAASGVACVTPQTSDVHALCAETPSGRVFGTDLSCANGGAMVFVDEPCGPLLLTTAEDDACVSFYDQSDGDHVVKPLSSHMTSEGDGPATGVDAS